jgi:hypothetical protein
MVVITVPATPASGGERNRLRQPRHQKLLSHEVMAWIKLYFVAF